MAPEYVRGLSDTECIQTFRCSRWRLFACYGLDPWRRILECVMLNVSIFQLSNPFPQMALLPSTTELRSSNDLWIVYAPHH